MDRSTGRQGSHLHLRRVDAIVPSLRLSGLGLCALRPSFAVKIWGIGLRLTCSVPGP